MSPVSMLYIVNEVDAAVMFYKEHLGFKVDATRSGICCAQSRRPSAPTQSTGRRRGRNCDARRISTRARRLESLPTGGR